MLKILINTCTSELIIIVVINILLVVYKMEYIAVIEDGVVKEDILDPNFEKYLPTIPSEVSQVNFTWKSGKKKYNYHFDILRTLDATVLEPPQISIKAKGRIPKKSKGEMTTYIYFSN